MTVPTCEPQIRLRNPGLGRLVDTHPASFHGQDALVLEFAAGDRRTTYTVDATTCRDDIAPFTG